MSAKDIFEKLVKRAFSWSLRLSGLRRTSAGKPGELIASLSPEEREELQNLTSKDTEVAQRELFYISGTYPESTTTIHTHSIKK